MLQVRYIVIFIMLDLASMLKCLQRARMTTNHKVSPS
jgi:hypothetical protein